MNRTLTGNQSRATSSSGPGMCAAVVECGCPVAAIPARCLRRFTLTGTRSWTVGSMGADGANQAPGPDEWQRRVFPEYLDAQLVYEDP